jgi:hypothetical protein
MSALRHLRCKSRILGLLSGLAVLLTGCLLTPVGATDAGRTKAGVRAAGADGGPDGGDAGPDVDDPDAGLIHSGVVDAGVMTLAVTANPNSVLSAIATVGWSDAPVAVTLAVTTNATTRTTPPVPVTTPASSMTIPVLPLKADTAYTIVASGVLAGGATVRSAPIVFATGTLPSTVPFFNVADGGTPSPGYNLVARLLPNGDLVTDYLTVADSTGAPIWYTGISPELGVDFQQQPDGTFTAAVNDPALSIPGLDETLVIYRQMDVLGNTLRTWTAQDVSSTMPPVIVAGTNGHDIRLQPNGDALLFGLTRTTMDLSSYGGYSAATVVSDVLERVTPSGELAFAWNARDALDIGNVDPEATNLKAAVVDFTHGNAIDVMTDGNYLLSLRGLSQVIKIDATTGAILWKLGGLDGDFEFVGDPLGGFSCQHGARQLPNGDILLFDDGDSHTPAQSRAVEYALDTTAMTATLIWSAEDDPPLYSYILGYAQRLTNGNTLVTYGTTFRVQEVAPDGSVLWSLHDPNQGFGTYRAYRIPSLSPYDLMSN